MLPGGPSRRLLWSQPGQDPVIGGKAIEAVVAPDDDDDEDDVDGRDGQDSKRYDDYDNDDDAACNARDARSNARGGAARNATGNQVQTSPKRLRPPNTAAS